MLCTIDTNLCFAFPTGVPSVTKPLFCTACGKPLGAGVRFCSNCGQALIASNTPTDTTSSHSHRAGMKLSTAVMLALIGSFFVVVIVLSNKGQEDTAQQLERDCRAAVKNCMANTPDAAFESRCKHAGEREYSIGCDPSAYGPLTPLSPADIKACKAAGGCEWWSYRPCTLMNGCKEPNKKPAKAGGSL